MPWDQTNLFNEVSTRTSLTNELARKNEIHFSLRSLHCLDSELFNFSNSSWGSILEGNAIKTLAHMNCIVSGDNISLWFSLSFCFHHLYYLFCCCVVMLIERKFSAFSSFRKRKFRDRRFSFRFRLIVTF
jgi:hypothetical protein